MAISEEPGPFWLRVQGLDCAADSNKISSPCLHQPTKTQGPTRKHPYPKTLPPPIQRRSEPATCISNPGPWSVVLGLWASNPGPWFRQGCG